ncbi:multidrug ABC transporter ATP-binding protein, partial [Escherichia coli]|nr:multidrug ABC transporter ATP-binding protein [Escherichia coli]
TQESLRAQIGMVTQDTSLLHRSIRDNLLYGRPGASDAELMEAVRKARADEFIPLLSDAEGRRGFDAHVGERGVKLSGGQRQRIALARALAAAPKILLIDEPFASLDVEAATDMRALVREELDRTGTSAIVVSHSAADALALADDLLVLERGRIIAQGTVQQVFAEPANRFV